MCRVLKVARAGFYDWLNKPLSDRAIENERLVELIRASYAASGGVYGSDRVFGDLREAGESCGRHHVARLMRANKIKAIRGYKSPRPIAGRPSIIAPNRLSREFTVDATNQAWVTTSPISEPGRAGFIWQSSSIFMRVVLWGGR